MMGNSWVMGFWNRLACRRICLRCSRMPRRVDIACRSIKGEIKEDKINRYGKESEGALYAMFWHVGHQGPSQDYRMKIFALVVAPLGKENKPFVGEISFDLFMYSTDVYLCTQITLPVSSDFSPKENSRSTRSKEKRWEGCTFKLSWCRYLGKSSALLPLK